VRKQVDQEKATAATTFLEKKKGCKTPHMEDLATQKLSQKKKKEENKKKRNNLFPPQRVWALRKNYEKRESSAHHLVESSQKAS